MIKYTPRPRAIADCKTNGADKTNTANKTNMANKTNKTYMANKTNMVNRAKANKAKKIQMNNQGCTFLKVELRLYSLQTSELNTFSFQSAIYLLITPRLLRGSRSKFICILMNGSKSLVKYNKQ